MTDRETVICDFCSMPAPPGAKAFDADDVTVPLINGMPLIYTGAWNACEPCANLIDISDAETLLERSIEMHSLKWTIEGRNEDGFAQGRRSLAKAHVAFWRSRK